MMVVRRLAEILAYLHEHGLAHRNLCPATIALSPTGAPLLFDLWWLGSFGPDRRVRSVLGRRSRTIYDAPEAGADLFNGQHADIYSLGVLVRELLPEGRCGDLVTSMTDVEPAARPVSMRVVLQELAAQA